MLELDFNHYSNRPALLFSGGVESTLLYYLMSKCSTINAIDLFIIDRHNRPKQKALSLYNLLGNTTHAIKVLELGMIPNSNQIKKAIEILLPNYDTIVCGANKLPPVKEIRPANQFELQDTDKVKFPLKDYTKDIIIQAFYDLGIESILPYTHSCGSDLDQPCGQCFNCKERIWAYDRLGITQDLGL